MSDDNAVAFIANGYPVTARQRDRAWVRWLRLPEGARRASRLEGYLEQEGVPGYVLPEPGGYVFPANRAADRLIQSARRRGEIIFVRPGGYWKIVEVLGDDTQD